MDGSEYRLKSIEEFLDSPEAKNDRYVDLVAFRNGKEHFFRQGQRIFFGESTDHEDGKLELTLQASFFHVHLLSLKLVKTHRYDQRRDKVSLFYEDSLLSKIRSNPQATPQNARYS